MGLDSICDITDFACCGRRTPKRWGRNFALWIMSPLISLYYGSNTNIHIRHMCYNCSGNGKRSIDNSNTAWRKTNVTSVSNMTKHIVEPEWVHGHDMFILNGTGSWTIFWMLTALTFVMGIASCGTFRGDSCSFDHGKGENSSTTCDRPTIISWEIVARQRVHAEN
jgi:hypothetical protein